MHSSGISPADNLSKEGEATRSLLDLLKKEQAELIDANIEGLTALTEEKAKVVAHMAALAASRHQALVAAGYPAKEEGMQAWLQSQEADTSDHESWTALLALTKEAKELNRVNGLLVNKHMVRNQAAMNVLRTNTHGGNFYGPDGQSSNTGLSTRKLVVG